MTDWNAIAEARKLDIPPEDLAQITPTLDALEEAFRPLQNRNSSYTRYRRMKIEQAAAKLRAREISAVELAQESLRRIRQRSLC